jgi:class 3 adenylate cyclase
MDGVRRELRRFELPGINIHIGVSTGTAMACNIGTQDHVSHTYIGDAVNVAKRLQDLAEPGEIITSEATASDLEGCEEEIPGLTRFLPLPPIELKGKQGQMVIYRVEYESNPQRA